MAQLIKESKRSEIDLIVEILQNTVEPVKKTNLLYMTRINFHQLVRYLTWLMSKGLVKNIEEPFAGFQITQKGVRFIKILDETKLPNALQTVV